MGWVNIREPGVLRRHCAHYDVIVMVWSNAATQNNGQQVKIWCKLITRARFLSFARSKLKLCSANHRAGYFSNLFCDWLSIVWAYSEQETENGSWTRRSIVELPVIWDAMTYGLWDSLSGALFAICGEFVLQESMSSGDNVPFRLISFSVIISVGIAVFFRNCLNLI